MPELDSGRTAHSKQAQDVQAQPSMPKLKSPQAEHNEKALDTIDHLLSRRRPESDRLKQIQAAVHLGRGNHNAARECLAGVPEDALTHFLNAIINTSQGKPALAEASCVAGLKSAEVSKDVTKLTKLMLASLKSSPKEVIRELDGLELGDDAGRFGSALLARAYGELGEHKKGLPHALHALGSPVPENGRAVLELKKATEKLIS